MKNFKSSSVQEMKPYPKGRYRVLRRNGGPLIMGVVFYQVKSRAERAAEDWESKGYRTAIVYTPEGKQPI